MWLVHIDWRRDQPGRSKRPGDSQFYTLTGCSLLAISPPLTTTHRISSPSEVGVEAQRETLQLERNRQKWILSRTLHLLLPSGWYIDLSRLVTYHLVKCIVYSCVGHDVEGDQTLEVSD